MRRVPRNDLPDCLTPTMPNHLDFLLVLDEATRAGHGAITTGSEMNELATDAGLAEWASHDAARWTGELVLLGYLVHRPSVGPRRPPPHPSWSDGDLQSVTDYRVTKEGREEADRMRRLARERLTDAALGAGMPRLLQPWMTDAQRHAIAEPVRGLRNALDADHATAAIGAAKNLIEAACKIVLEHAGEPIPRAANLSALFTQASRANGDDTKTQLGRSIAASVERLGDLRNAVGAGHGHERLQEVSARHGRLAAAAAVGIADFLLNASRGG